MITSGVLGGRKLRVETHSLRSVDPGQMSKHHPMVDVYDDALLFLKSLMSYSTRLHSKHIHLNGCRC